jgi:hypothetical protein
MHALAGLANVFREQRFQRGLSVFLLQRDLPFAASMLFRNLRQSSTNRFQVFGRQQPVRVQHLRMRYRCARVIDDQTIV